MSSASEYWVRVRHTFPIHLASRRAPQPLYRYIVRPQWVGVRTPGCVYLGLCNAGWETFADAEKINRTSR